MSKDVENIVEVDTSLPTSYLTGDKEVVECTGK